MPSSPAGPRTARAAIVLGVVSVAAALMIPLAPVRQQVATFTWPVGGSTVPVQIPLSPYHAESVEADFACETAAALAQRDPGGTVFATMPPSSPEGRRDGLLVQVVDGELRVTSRGRLVSTTPAGSEDGCRWGLAVDASAVEVSRDGQRVARMDEDLRPQVVGVFSDLDAASDPVDGLAVRVRSDTRFQTSPTTLKQGIILLAVLALIGALGALYRLDRLSTRVRLPTAEPRPRWRPRAPDLLVCGVLAVWAVIGPFTVDDGYILNIIKSRQFTGFIGNHYHWVNTPEAPFGYWYEIFYGWAKVSPSLLWMRTLPLLLGVTSWLLVSRLVLARMGERLSTSRWLSWAAGVAFLAFWMPYNHGLRPEPFVVVGTLLTLRAVERVITTRRLLPLALAVVAAVATVAVTPTGLIALLPLLVAPRRLAAVLSARRGDGLVPLTAAAAAGACTVLVLMFYDQTASTVMEAARVRDAIGPSLGWEREVERYERLLDPLAPEGALARRTPVLLLIGTLVLMAATMLRARLIPGVAAEPARRLVLVTGLAFGLISLTPTKWALHFGAFAGLAAAVLTLGMWTLSTTLVAGPRARAAAFAGVAVSVALSLAAANVWPFGSTFDPPLFDRWITVAGLPLHTVVLALSVLACLVTVALTAWSEARETAPPRPPLPPPHAVLALALCLAVLGQLYTFVLAPLDQRDTYSVAKQNLKSVLSHSCGLAEWVMVELDPASGALPSLRGPGGRDEPGVFALNGGFEPAHLPPHGFGAEGQRRSLPVWGSLVGEHPDLAVGTARTRWYELAQPLKDGLLPLVFSVAGRTHSGNHLTVELGRLGDEGVDPLGTLDVDEFAERPRNNIEPEANRLRMHTPEWRDLRIDLRDRLPEEADALRLVATDGSVGPGGWLAFSAPRAPQLTPLSTITAGGGAVMVDWNVAAAYPCIGPVSLALGVVEIPGWRIAGGNAEFGTGSITLDRFGGGSVAALRAITTEHRVPAYLADQWHEDVAQVFRIDPLPLDSPAVSVTPKVVPGWSRQPPLVIPGIDDVRTLE